MDLTTSTAWIPVAAGIDLTDGHNGGPALSVSMMPDFRNVLLFPAARFCCLTPSIAPKSWTWLGQAQLLHSVKPLIVL